ncbi:MAG TPA: GNAT family N-acetyltransferase [Beijerinckiaceae bacterium]|jgi:putative acetyltransferase
MTPAPAKPALRPFLPADAPVLAAIFRESIEELTGEDYSAAQAAAWAAFADDEAAFGAHLARHLTLVATLDGAPAGFAALKEPDHVDMLYVHPGVAGQGVARLLVDALEKLARARGATRLTADASDTARGFFEKRGFEARHRNTTMRGDEWLGNTRMEKRFAGEGAR